MCFHSLSTGVSYVLSLAPETSISKAFQGRTFLSYPVLKGYRSISDFVTPLATLRKTSVHLSVWRSSRQSHLCVGFCVCLNDYGIIRLPQPASYASITLSKPFAPYEVFKDSLCLHYTIGRKRASITLPSFRSS